MATAATEVAIDETNDAVSIQVIWNVVTNSDRGLVHNQGPQRLGDTESQVLELDTD